MENRFEARLGIAPADAGGGQARPGRPPLAGRGARRRRQGGRRCRARCGSSARASIRPRGWSMRSWRWTSRARRVLIGTYLRAEIVVEKKEALLAPRAAVLPERRRRQRRVLFTVKRRTRPSSTRWRPASTTATNVEITGGGGRSAGRHRTSSPKALTNWRTRWPVDEIGKDDDAEDNGPRTPKEKDAEEDKAP